MGTEDRNLRKTLLHLTQVEKLAKCVRDMLPVSEKLLQRKVIDKSKGRYGGSQYEDSDENEWESQEKPDSEDETED